MRLRNEMLLAVGLGLVGCAADAAGGVGGDEIYDDENISAEETLGETNQELYGAVSSESSCRPHDAFYLQKVMHWGRIIASTNAFAQCVDQKMRADYKRCWGDPYYSSTMSERIRRVTTAARSPNDVVMSCRGPVWNAQAHVGQYGMSGAERWQWGENLTEAFDSMHYPVCTAGQAPSTHRCKFGPEPGNWIGFAGTAWHEAMHQHGYRHGDGDNAQAMSDCRQSAPFNYQANTVPYIVGNCIFDVGQRSISRCGLPLDSKNILTGDRLRLIDGYDSTQCATYTDPRRWGDLDIRYVWNLETDKNRYGNDYNGFTLAPMADYVPCLDACKRDGVRCKAFTYVPAGVQGPVPMCWLKSTSAGATSSAQGFVSGVPQR